MVVLQAYSNESNSPIEAKYVFPLDDAAAVCGFEAFINDKHIIGQVWPCTGKGEQKLENGVFCQKVVCVVACWTVLHTGCVAIQYT